MTISEDMKLSEVLCYLNSCRLLTKKTLAQVVSLPGLRPGRSLTFPSQSQAGPRLSFVYSLPLPLRARHHLVVQQQRHPLDRLQFQSSKGQSGLEI